MIIGTDSYVTVAAADEYIFGHYRSGSKDRKRWDGLSAEDKEVLLRQACTEIEALPFRGRKVVSEQTLSFPRLPYQYGCAVGAPESVQRAQVELALWLSDDTRQSGINRRQELQSQGVTSFGIGDLSESYKAGGGVKSAPLLCPKCASLLSPFLSGGYGLC